MAPFEITISVQQQYIKVVIHFLIDNKHNKTIPIIKQHQRCISLIIPTPTKSAKPFLKQDIEYIAHMFSKTHIKSRNMFKQNPHSSKIDPIPKTTSKNIHK